MSDACGCDAQEPRTSEQTEERGPWGLWRVSEIRFAAVAGVLLAMGHGAGWADGPTLLALVLKAVALAVGAWTFVPSTLARLSRGGIGVGTLMTVAAVGAVLLGEVGEAAMLAFLYSIAEGLEEYSIARTRRGLRALLGLVPEQAAIIRGGVEQVVPVEELRLGDTMIVRPGERLATDGRIASGRTALDTSAITGESIPVEAGPGDEVFAGSINGGGVLEVAVTSTASDNSLARIVEIVEAEHARKGAAQRLADRIARPLVPGVMVAAVLVAALGSLLGDPLVWIGRALVVLVAASPCALAISVPVTVMAGIGAASRHGVLVKGGAALEMLGRIGTVALDKTGTLTRNRPSVLEVVAAPGRARAEVLKIAGALEARSEHPLASAILAESPGGDAADEVEAVPGAGLTGVLGGRRVRLGRRGWIEAGPLAAEVERMQHAGATAVVVEEAGEPIGAIAVRDEPRPEAGEVVGYLRRGGYRVAMLTGDNAATATALAREVGIDAVHAELRPEGKVDLVRELRTGGPVAMVGDGVNDAPALASADLGVAMGAMGSDVAIETADVALMGEDLRHLPGALAHARRARMTMQQNVGLSLAIIAVLPALALLGVLGLAAVVLVHEVAEVVVIANGVRAGRGQAHGLEIASVTATPRQPTTARIRAAQ